MSKRPPENDEPRLDDVRESIPLLLARPSRIPAAEPAPETPRRPRTSAAPKSAAPPLAGVNWTNPGAFALRLGKVSLLVAGLLLLLSIFADIVASDLPIMCKLHGTVFVMPNVTRPAELDGMDRRTLEAEADWTVRPLVAHGPRLGPGEERVPLLAPGARGHLFGTDREGRDVFARVVHGTRSYLVFALAAVLASLALGVLLGAIAGLFGGPIDVFVSRVVESVSAFPPLVLVLGIQAAVPHPTLLTLFLAIALTRWPEIARLVRGEVILAATRDYVLAARALGASPLRVLRRHIMPNVRAPLVVAASVGVSAVVLTEASLDFLRVGTPAGAASWGETMSQFRDAPSAWWLLAFPGVLLVVTIIACNLMGEALRNALDPRAR
ncbi:MAG: Dipeptide transport system permease protein DppC [Labilithrix sp.]|nr:Dipeptide transport system permease protein DppC [Labilithrix sp.]